MKFQMCKGLQALKDVFTHLPHSKHFDRVFGHAHLISAANGRCVFELKIDVEHTNMFGTLHGGLSATLIDGVTTYALLTTKKALPGVSVNLNCSYLKAAKIGSIVIVDGKVLRVGKTLAFTSAEIRLKDTDELLVSGTHTKAFPGA